MLTKGPFHGWYLTFMGPGTTQGKKNNMRMFLQWCADVVLGNYFQGPTF